MKRGTLQAVHSWGPLLLVFLAMILAGNQISPTGAVVYRDSSYGGYGGFGGFGGFGYGNTFLGGFSFIEFYQNYAPFVDAFIFLLIFLSVGKAILQEHFKKGGKALYMGVGIFLAFALLLWEEQAGISLLEVAGPYAGLLLVLIILVIVYRFITAAGASAVFAMGIIYLILYFTVLADPNTWAYGFMSHLLVDPNIRTALSQFAGILAMVAILFIIGSFFYHLWNRRNARSVPPGRMPWLGSP